MPQHPSTHASETAENPAEPDPLAGKTVVISGVGLIGGSIGLALRQAGRVKSVIGLGRNPQRLSDATRVGAIDQATTDWPTALAKADIVVLCGPVSTIAEQARTAWQHRAGDEILITDAGSTKLLISNEIQQTPGLAGAFVGGHPIAGSERSGVEAARADLFRNRTCVITPTPQTCPARLALARSFWQSLGSRVVQMPPDEHDQALAYSSHLPHVLAAALARVVPADVHPLTAGAFRDMTRIAAADADLWRDIFLANRDSLDKTLEQTIRELINFREILKNESSSEIAEWWNMARHQRLAYENQGQ